MYNPEFDGDSDGWVGSLQAFEGGSGYWMVATDDFEFSFNGIEGGLTRSEQPKLRRVPEVYSYRQSDQQSFFFVESATILGEDLNSGLYIVAYNGDVIVGARYWNGEYTDIPVMGIDSDSNERTSDYCADGDKITFKVLVASSDELVEMDADIELIWTNMGMPIVNLTDALPLEVSLDNAYPNPFNPTTTLNYAVPSDMNVTLAIYDMRGRLVDELVNNMHARGIHQVVWNADQYASGVYMVNMTAGDYSTIQKVMLIK
jgi:hypothetical protein